MTGPSVRESHSQLIRSCIQCGTCTAACPTSQVTDFHIRRMVRRLQLGLTSDPGFLGQIPWLCTQCDRCEVLCTEGLDLPDLVLALRRLALAEGHAPEVVTQTGQTILDTGSPYQSLTRTKASWLDDSIRPNDDAEVLYWVGCTPSMMSHKLARATAKVLQEVGDGFRLLPEEPCCGEPLSVLGLDEEAKETAKRTLDAIRETGVKKVVVSCAGCFNAFTNLYHNRMGLDLGDIEILHLSQYLMESGDENEAPEQGSGSDGSQPLPPPGMGPGLPRIAGPVPLAATGPQPPAATGPQPPASADASTLPTPMPRPTSTPTPTPALRPKLILKLPEPMRVTYHDPCSLGREAGVYDEPRALLRTIEGLELVEMDPAGEKAMCCGGGGGMWAHQREKAMEIAAKKLELCLPRSTTNGAKAGDDDREANGPSERTNASSAHEAGVDAIVTPCPMCCNNFRYTLRKMRSKVKVLELAQVVEMALPRG